MTTGYGTVTISAVDYTILGTLTGATTYHQASLRTSAIWAAASSTVKAQALVEATRQLDLQPWAGDKTDPDQAHAWPRTGVVDPDATDGSELPDDEIPTRVEVACYEIAAQLIGDVAAFDDGGENAGQVKRVDAKGVSVEFFGPRAGTGGTYPSWIQALLAPYLAAGASPAAGMPTVSGCGTSQGDDADRYDRRLP